METKQLNVLDTSILDVETINLIGLNIQIR